MAIFISPRKPSKMQMRRKSSKPSNGLNRLVYRLCMESILMKRSIIIIRPVSRSESGLNKQDLTFSKTVMARYGITTSCYKSYRFILRIKQRLTMRAPGKDHPGTPHPIPDSLRRGHTCTRFRIAEQFVATRASGAVQVWSWALRVRVFRQVSWLEVGSIKVVLSRPAPPDRACRDHQYPYGA